jgi:hypothetical protein
MEEYNKLREYELEAAIIESELDIRNGNFKKGSVEEHIERLENV